MVEIESWPWPVKIYTLGRFAIIKNGNPVVFSRKVQEKTLELLKAVIALGVEEVREEQISDLLWPDADGDAAHNSFKMALSRLRQLIGSDAVDFQEGKASLNPGYVWIDTAAFRLVSEKAEAEWKELRGLDGEKQDTGTRLARAMRLTEKAFSLYRGVFSGR